MVDGLPHTALEKLQIMLKVFVGERRSSGASLDAIARELQSEAAASILDSSQQYAFLYPESGWPDPVDPDAFHGRAGEFVRLVGPHT